MIVWLGHIRVNCTKTGYFSPLQWKTGFLFICQLPKISYSQQIHAINPITEPFRWPCLRSLPLDTPFRHKLHSCDTKLLKTNFFVYFDWFLSNQSILCTDSRRPYGDSKTQDIPQRHGTTVLSTTSPYHSIIEMKNSNYTPWLMISRFFLKRGKIPSFGTIIANMTKRSS